MQEVRAITRQFKGVNLLVPPETLPPEMFLVDQNGDRRRGLSWRVRPGYRRLFSGSSQYVDSFVANDDFPFATYGSGLGSEITDNANWDEYTFQTFTPTGPYGIFVQSSGSEVITAECDPADTTLFIGAARSESYGNDQYAQAVLESVATLSTTMCGVAVRFGEYDTGRNGCYAALFGDFTGTNTLAICWINFFGQSIQFLDSKTFAANDGDIMRLDAVGSALTLRINGVIELTATHTSHTSGPPGVLFYLSGTEYTDGTLDSFTSGDLNSAATAVKAAGAPRHLLAFERDDNEAQLVVSSPGVQEAFGTGTPEGV